MSTIPVSPLKTAAYYILEDDTTHIQFKAELKYESFFKIPVAEFKWPDGTIKTVSAAPFTGKLTYSDPLPFIVEYRSGIWRANLRPRP